MRNTIKLVILVLLLQAFPSGAQDSLVSSDNLVIDTREFGTLDEYRSDDDFDYTMDRISSSEASFWQRLWNWISQSISRIFSLKIGDFEVGKILIYLFMISGIAFGIYKLIKMNSRSIFDRNPESGMNYDISDENIHVLDFENLLKEAVDTKQFKRAIRLTYLYALKILSDKQRIHWQPGKTNLDYFNEIQDPSERAGFSELGYYFEYAWYGEFDITSTEYQNVRETFVSWRKQCDL